jgi:hypothetical protein
VPTLVQALDDVRVRPYVADALGAIGDERARAPLLALFAAESHVTARPHEARALLALGARDWLAAAPAPVAQATLALPAGAPAPSVVLVLLSDAQASLEAAADGVALATQPAGTEVRSLDVVPNGSRRLRLDLRASSGGVVALWLVAAARLD